MAWSSASPGRRCRPPASPSASRACRRRSPRSARTSRRRRTARGRARHGEGPHADYQKMAQSLRQAGIRAEMYLGTAGMKAQMKYADKRGAPCVVIQGGDERAKGEVQIKDLIEGAKAAATIKDSKEWREGRPAQVSVTEDDLVAKPCASPGHGTRANVNRCADLFPSPWPEGVRASESPGTQGASNRKRAIFREATGSRISATLDPSAKGEGSMRAARGEPSSYHGRGSRTEGGGPRSPGAAPVGRLYARRLRAGGARHHPAGGPVPRRGRRGPARAHLRLHRSRRRGAVPAPRPHRADLPAAPGAPPRAATCRRATATAARPSAISRAAPTARTRASSARPASSSSPPRTASTTMRPCWPSSSRRCARLASSSSSSRSAISASSRALLEALRHAEALAAAAAALFLASRGVPRRAGSPDVARRPLQALGVPRELMDALDPARPRGGPGPRRRRYLDQSGLELIGTRTLPEIAERLLAEAADARETPLPARHGPADRKLRRRSRPPRARRPAGSRRCIRPHKLDLGDGARSPSGAGSI